MNTTTTDTLASRTIANALNIATDYGQRTWTHAPEVTENAWGGYDVVGYGSERLYRITEEDGTLAYHVFTDRRSMVLEATATVHASLAHMIANEIGQALR